MTRYLPSLQRLALALGMPSIDASSGVDALLPYLELMRSEGAVVVLKLDGQRGPADTPPYTAVVSVGELGDDFLRMDAASLVDAAAYVIVSYARACWGFSDAPPTGPAKSRDEADATTAPQGLLPVAAGEAIGLHTRPEELESRFESASGTLPDGLDVNLTSSDLIALAGRHEGFRHWTALLQLVAVHRATDEDVLRWIVSHTEDPGTLDAVATSPHVSRHILERLALSESTGVREHARLGLIGLDLEMLPTERFEEILDRHLGDAGIDIPVRCLLAQHPRTPPELLRRLSTDDVDIVRATAAERQQC